MAESAAGHVGPEVEVGVDIGGTKMLLLARDIAGELVAEARSSTGPAVAGAELELAISRFCRGLDRPVTRLAIAVPGLIDRRGEVLVCDVLPRLVGWRPTADLVINDIRAALASVIAAPAALGDAAGPLLCVVAGTAIGAAFTDCAATDAFTGAAGWAFTGAAGWAGELGYLPHRADDGQVLRLDDVAGGAALLARLGVTAEGLHRRLVRGDLEARASVDAAGTALGLGLAACINMLNPRVVVLGGGTCGFPGYREAALAAEAHSLPQSWASLRVASFVDEHRFAADGALAAARAACPV